MSLATLLLSLVPAQEDPGLERRQGAPTALEARLIEGLRRAEPGTPPDPAFVADARAGLSDLFEILRAGLPSGASEEGHGLPLEPVQEQWILGSARAAGRSDVLPLALAMFASQLDVQARSAAIRLIGTVGVARDLEELLALPLVDQGSLDRRLCDALAQAAGEILGRDPYAFAYVSSRWRSLHEALLEPLILATRAAPGATALEFLADVIEWRAAHARLAMAMVQEIGRSHDPAADAEVRRRIRPLLHRTRVDLCRAAALALGALEDRGAIRDLIPLLEGDDGLRANAHWALRRITGLSLPASPEVWERWHQLESTWFAEAGRKTLRRLRSDDPGEVAEAVRSLSAHPLAREELAGALVELLASPDPAIRTLACRFLPDLCDRRALPALVGLLEDGDEAVSAAALEALRRMTGRELPLDSVAWKAVLSQV